MGTSSALATARPHEALPAERVPAEGGADAAADVDSAAWRPVGALAGGDDPLLASLVSLTELLERPASAQALVAGLPLPDDGRLTPELAVRAAARAGLETEAVKRDLKDIPALVLPAVLVMKDGTTRILTSTGNGTTGTVEFVSYLGALMDIHVRLSPADRVVVQIANRDGSFAPQVGQQVHVGWPAAAGLVFTE